MCKHGNTTDVLVNIPARLSHTGEARWDVKGIDSCIAPIVKALNEAGILTSSSCCGHGRIAATIQLQDGREVLVMQADENGFSAFTQAIHHLRTRASCLAMFSALEHRERQIRQKLDSPQPITATARRSLEQESRLGRKVLAVLTRHIAEMSEER